MGGQESELVRFLRVLDGCGLLPHVVLIGSWAELVWEGAGMLSGFSPDIRTQDMDFLVRNLRRPPEPARLTEAAKNAGYLVDVDRITGVTKIYAREGLEVEFLIAKVGAGLEEALPTHVGVTAQALRHLETLSRWAVTVTYDGMRVNVPLPEAWAAHKMVINRERGAKRQKDDRAIAQLWPHLDTARFDEVAASLTRRERARVDVYLREHRLPGAPGEKS